VRRETVEHPFATLKMRMGATHFLMKTLPKVATEMATRPRLQPHARDEHRRYQTTSRGGPGVRSVYCCARRVTVQVAQRGPRLRPDRLQTRYSQICKNGRVDVAHARLRAVFGE
jgi:hypothetical protein